MLLIVETDKENGQKDGKRKRTSEKTGAEEAISLKSKAVQSLKSREVQSAKKVQEMLRGVFKDVVGDWKICVHYCAILTYHDVKCKMCNILYFCIKSNLKEKKKIVISKCKICAHEYILL